MKKPCIKANKKVKYLKIGDYEIAKAIFRLNKKEFNQKYFNEWLNSLVISNSKYDYLSFQMRDLLNSTGMLGATAHSGNLTRILLDSLNNYNNLEYKKASLLYTILHEKEHAYQYNFKDVLSKKNDLYRYMYAEDLGLVKNWPYEISMFEIMANYNTILKYAKAINNKSIPNNFETNFVILEESFIFLKNFSGVLNRYSTTYDKPLNPNGSTVLLALIKLTNIADITHKYNLKKLEKTFNTMVDNITLVYNQSYKNVKEKTLNSENFINYYSNLKLDRKVRYANKTVANMANFISAIKEHAFIKNKYGVEYNSIKDVPMLDAEYITR